MTDELPSGRVPNRHHPEGAARITLSAALDAAGPSWEDLADAIENGTNYENDTIHVSVALKALTTAFEYAAEQAALPPPAETGDDELVARLRGAGLGDGEFFVDGDTFDLMFAPQGTNFANAHKIVGRFACGETAYKLPGIVAELLNRLSRKGRE